MNETPSSTNDLREDKASMKSRAFLGIFLFTLCVLVLGVLGFFVISPFFMQKNGQGLSTNPSPTIDIDDTNDPNIANSILTYINKFLKLEYRVSELPPLDPIERTGIGAMKIIEVKGQKFLVKDHKKTQAVLTEEKQQQDDSLETVLRIFNKFYIMPEASKSAWIKQDIQNGKSYELIIDNPDGSYDTRSSYAVKDSSGTYLIGLIACHRVPDTDDNRKTCL